MEGTPIPSRGDLSVLVVDDHATFADLLTLAISAQPGLYCVGTATTPDRALAMVRALRPAVVVMDVDLGDGDIDGLTLTARMTAAYPALRVVVLTGRVDTRVLERAAKAGACSLLPKSGPLFRVLRSLKESRPGEFDVDPGLLRELVLTRHDDDAVHADSDLTPREREVLRLLAEGLDVSRIGERLSISRHTTRGHVKAILAKLGAHSQLEAVAAARRAGLVPSDS